MLGKDEFGRILKYCTGHCATAYGYILQQNLEAFFLCKYCLYLPMVTYEACLGKFYFKGQRFQQNQPKIFEVYRVINS